MTTELRTVSRPTRVAVDVHGGRVRATALDPGDAVMPRVLHSQGNSLTVALIGHAASLLAGDRLELDIDVGPGATLTLVEPSGTVAYDARGGHAEWSARLRVGPGGRLNWAAAPFVVACGADVIRTVDIRLEEDATAVLSELLVLGRSHEAGGAIRSHQEVWRGVTPLLIEDLDLRDLILRSRPGVLGDHRVLGTVGCYGKRPTEIPPEHGTALAGPGALLRVLGRAAHEVLPELTRAWDCWQ
jgi:urease accessory protein